MASPIPDWLRVANTCRSSYKRNDLGWVLYGLVRAYKPMACVELGVLEGYSAIFTAAALKDNGMGHLWGYDLFEEYPYQNATQAFAQSRIDAAGLTQYVTLTKYDAHDVPDLLRQSFGIDFLHVDLSNDGDTLTWALDAFRLYLTRNALVVFEGGSERRDDVSWMKQYRETPIRKTLIDLLYWDWFVIDPPVSEGEPVPCMTLLRRR